MSREEELWQQEGSLCTLRSLYTGKDNHKMRITPCS